MSQVDHKSSAKVLLRQKNFKAAIKLSEQCDGNYQSLFLITTTLTISLGGGGGGGQGRQDFGTHTKCLGPHFDQTCGYEDPE